MREAPDLLLTQKRRMIDTIDTLPLMPLTAECRLLLVFVTQMRTEQSNSRPQTHLFLSEKERDLYATQAPAKQVL